MPQKGLDINLSKICRICLVANKPNFVDIFTNLCVKKNIWYAEMLSNCIKIRRNSSRLLYKGRKESISHEMMDFSPEPYQGDGLPRLICKECSRQLKRTYTFITLCEESDQKLRCYLDNKSENVNDVHNLMVKDEDDCKEKKIKRNEYQNGENYSKNDTLELKFCTDINVDSNNEDNEGIKLEPSYMEDGEDSGWDADDDNLALTEVKLQKEGEGSNTQINNEHPRKKRGRKKKVPVEGEAPSVPDSKLPHQCDVCGKLLSTKSNLKAHKICHTDLRPFKCTECPASFKGHSALFQHKKVHTRETPYHCEFCPKRFSRRSGLVNHVRMHRGDRQYSCEICLKAFVQSAQLNIHMKRHMGVKSFLCQDCGKGFPIKSDLKVHQRVHNGEKPYACHLCTKTFATSGNLSIHVRIHNKEVRYNCSECQRGFVTCSAYKVHLKRHKGQRDYRCECGKTFYTSSALKQHRVVHTGEKKYQCKICERKFTQTSHLSRHFKREHAKPNVPVPPSDHYKVVVARGEGCQLFGTIDVQRVAGHPGSGLSGAGPGVKCEGS